MQRTRKASGEDWKAVREREKKSTSDLGFGCIAVVDGDVVMVCGEVG